MKIVIPGGTGQVGQILARHFHANNHAVTVLSRSPHPAPWRVVTWDGLTAGPWVGELENSDVCINLAGRSVNCRYHPANRRAIFDSRVHSTQNPQRGHRRAQSPTRRLAQRQHRHHLSPLPRPPHGRNQRRTRRQRTRRTRHLELLHPGRQSLGRGLLLHPHSPHPQSRPAQRHDLQPRSRRSLRRLPLARPPRPRRHQRQRQSIRLLDPRDRFHPLHRTPHRHRRTSPASSTSPPHIHSPIATSSAQSAKPGAPASACPLHPG